MNTYSISDIERMSGVKAHTLRMWEKRYGFLKPHRSSSNARFYRDEDIELLMNAVFLNRKGFKISKIACLSEDKIKSLVSDYRSETLGKDQLGMEHFLEAIDNLDERRFLEILDNYIEQSGLENAMCQMIYPLLDRLGIMWISGSISSVHKKFVLSLMKRRIVLAINNVNKKGISKPVFILFLPDRETYEMSLLYLHYMLVLWGCRVVNLSTGITTNEVKDVCRKTRSDFAFTIINHLPKDTSLQDYVNGLADKIKPTKLLLTGYAVRSEVLSLPDKVHILDGLAAVKKYI